MCAWLGYEIYSLIKTIILKKKINASISTEQSTDDLVSDDISDSKN